MQDDPAKGQRHAKLVLLTSLFLLLSFAASAFFSSSHQKKTPPLLIDTDGAPFIGNPQAPGQMIVFEDPLCASCRTFSLDVFPQLKKEMIDTHKIGYTCIPIALKPPSDKIVEAFLSVYYQDPQRSNPELFFSYLKYWFQNYEDSVQVDEALLIDMAKNADAAIDLRSLSRSLKAGKWKEKVDKDTLYARILAGQSGKLPLIFFNGILIEMQPWDEFKEQLTRN